MNCPYHGLPSSSWWSEAVARRRPEDLDPHLASNFRISRRDRVATAGSCFAQHISRALLKRDYNYFVTEPAPNSLPLEQARRYNYGVFSARYGNIYTTLQLQQLVERAFDELQPEDQFWDDGQGRCFDLLRPRIMPRGFSSRAEAESDSRHHLAAVRKLFETTQIFLFTMGLTECWVSISDHVAYPSCPGCGSAGDYNSAKYEFRNLSVAETTACLSRAIDRIRVVNPTVQVVLTVSPVPLIATMEPRHVLQATVYSKSVLRVAAEEIVRQYSNTHYFASYEFITSTRNEYLGEDRRTVLPEGVDATMDLFFSRFGEEVAHENSVSQSRGNTHEVADATGVICDDEEFFRAVAKLNLG